MTCRGYAEQGSACDRLSAAAAELSTSNSPAPTHSASTTTKPSFRLTLLVSSLLPFIIMPGPNNAKWGNGSHYCVITPPTHHSHHLLDPPLHPLLRLLPPNLLLDDPKEGSILLYD
ncbi:hypothetical protein PCASD_18661 [Puccinia coronata f. sp. avenae]|uniref:Uncharacterized protein n=1 Tax=Puccinia coronata f. sp. avenae TaxID=200324 RepID=A0A2N5UF04_9BASI|nr:hypothetical protein PCASD_18661 [Puccinia coronata f. sp. avenae]